jgi:hypothetical protein
MERKNKACANRRVDATKIQLKQQNIRNLKAEMFNRRAADPENKPNEIINALELRYGQKIADIGASRRRFCSAVC